MHHTNVKTGFGLKRIQQQRVFQRRDGRNKALFSKETHANVVPKRRRLRSLATVSGWWSVLEQSELSGVSVLGDARDTYD